MKKPIINLCVQIVAIAAIGFVAIPNLILLVAPVAQTQPTLAALNGGQTEFMVQQSTFQLTDVILLTVYFFTGLMIGSRVGTILSHITTKGK